MKKLQVGWRDSAQSAFFKIFSVCKIIKLFSHIKEETRISLSRMCCSYKVHILWIIIAYCALHTVVSILSRTLRIPFIIGFVALIYTQYWWLYWKRAIKKIEDRILEVKVIQQNIARGRLILIAASILITYSEKKPVEICIVTQAFFILETLNEISLLCPTICHFVLMFIHFHCFADLLKHILPISLFVCIYFSLSLKSITKIASLAREAKKHLKMQEMYSSLLNSTNDCIIIMSQDKKLLFQNVKSVKDFEITPENLHQKFKQISCKPSYESLYEYLSTVFYKARYHKPILCQYSKMKEFGKQSDYEVTIEQLYFKRRIAIFLKDITESKELKFAKNQERFQRKVICSISHELLNPVNVIIGSLDLLADELKSSDTKSLIDTIYNNSQILHYKIKDFIDYGTLCNGTFKPKNTPFNLSNILKLLFNICTAMITGDHVDLRFNVQKNIPEQLEMDSSRLMQIILKLVSNSIKHTESGKVELNVNQLSQSTLQFEVVDTGKGIPTHIINYIETEFKPLYDDTGSRSSLTGTLTPNTANIGLLTIKKILESLGSKLEIKTGRKCGTTVSFTLSMYSNPKRKVSSKKVDTDKTFSPTLSKEAPSVCNVTQCLASNTSILKTMKTLQKGPSKPSLIPPIIIQKESDCLLSQETMITKFRTRACINPSSYRKNEVVMEIPSEDSNVDLKLSIKEKKPKSMFVLLVDDMKQNRLLFKRFLKEVPNITVSEFVNGKEVLQYMQQNADNEDRYHIIMMDIDMPVMNGIEATRNIMNIPNISNKVTIIAVSAFKEAKDIETCKNAGMAKHMAKPVDKAALIDTVTTVIEHKK